MSYMYQIGHTNNGCQKKKKEKKRKINGDKR